MLERCIALGAEEVISLVLPVQIGRLWGMVACYYLQQRRVPYAIRMTADVIAQMFAATVQTLEAQRHAASMRVRRAQAWSPPYLVIARHMQEELHRASIALQAETDLARAQLMAMRGHNLCAPLNAIQMAAVKSQGGGPSAPMGLRIHASSAA